MVIAIFFAVCLSAVLGASQADDNIIQERASRVKRIIGGEPIQVGQYPWLVNVRGHVPIKYFWRFAVAYADIYCGGAIIHRRWILTAAHCFDVAGIPKYGLSQTINWYVKAGDNKRTFSFGQRLCAIWNRISGTQNIHCWYVGVEKIVSHPQFSGQDNWSNDIALVKLSQDLPLEVDKTIDVVNLPDMSSWPSPGADCSIQGWGCTTSDGALEDIAHSIDVPTLDDSQCTQSGQTTIGPRRLCAGYRGGSSGLCKGDSGGPLVCRDDKGAWRQAGIASFTSAVSPGSVPGVFTRVAQYVDWINSTIIANTS